MDGRVLTQADVEGLLADPSPLGRLEIAGKVGRQFAGNVLSAEERELAAAIFRVLAADAEVRVREALSSVLSDCPDLPHDLAVALAHDVNSVALPVIMKSIVLTDEDLIAIVRAGESEKQIGVAQRPAVSAAVSADLAATDNHQAIATLVANPGAHIPEPALHGVLERFATHADIHEAIAGRAQLPISVMEKLIATVGERISDRLLHHEQVSDAVATDIAMRMRARLIMSLSSESDDERLDELVYSLHKHNRLSPALVIRAACMGDLRFFEAAAAMRAGLALENTLRLMQDRSGRGLAALCRRAGIPEVAIPAVRAAIDVAEETEYDGRENDQDRFTRRVIERVLTQWGDLGVFLDEGDLDYLLGKIMALPPCVAEEQAERP